MVFRLANLGQIIVLRKGTVLTNKLKSAYKVVVTVDHFLNLGHRSCLF